MLTGDRAVILLFKRTFNLNAPFVRAHSSARREPRCSGRDGQDAGTTGRWSGANGRQCDPACASAPAPGDQGQDPRRGGIPVHGARVRGDESAVDHGRRRREPGFGQLPLREQGGTVPGGPHPAARPDEPGACRPSHPARARRRAGRAALRPDPVGDVHPGAAACARPGARRQGFPPSARARLRRPRAVHPQIPRGAVRGP